MANERALPGQPHWPSLAPPHLSRYLFACEFADSKRVLDAGTGAEYGALILKRSGAKEVVAVDLDDEAIAYGQKHYGNCGVIYRVDDCESLNCVDGPFDLICNFENIEHLNEPGMFLASAARLLAPDGMLITSTPDRACTPSFKDNKPTNPFHVNEWYRDEFGELLSKAFAQFDMRVQIRSNDVVAREKALEAIKQGLTWNNPLRA